VRIEYQHIRHPRVFDKYRPVAQHQRPWLQDDEAMHVVLVIRIYCRTLPCLLLYNHDDAVENKHHRAISIITASLPIRYPGKEMTTPGDIGHRNTGMTHTLAFCLFMYIQPISYARLRFSVARIIL